MTPAWRGARGWLLLGGGLTMSAIAPAAGVDDAISEPGTVAFAHTPTPVDDGRFVSVAERLGVGLTGTPLPSEHTRRPFRPNDPMVGLTPVPATIQADQRPDEWAAAPPVASQIALHEATRPFGISEEAAHAIVVTARSPVGSAALPADIEQVATIAQGREPMVQLSDARGEPRTMLAESVAAMQVGMPGGRDNDRAAMLALAPEQLTLRIGNTALGRIDIAMADTGTISVRLRSLLDVMAERMDADEYEQLRSSSAAGDFVSLAMLRDAGIAVDYDPAYDELRLSV